ncbi:MAG TPA: hypothetical protein VII28_07315, partial [Puia sp.]
DLVLFESVRGYLSEGDAQDAFDAEYMLVLQHALDPSQYGIDHYISTEEVFIQDSTGKCHMLKSIVFIPERTKEIIPWYNVDQLVKKIIDIVKLYPIRLITESKGDRSEFKKRFPCFPLTENPLEPCTCQGQPTVNTYYYFILCDRTGQEIWQSEWPKTDLEQIRQQFYFFLILLLYPGNYFVKQDDCTCLWSIYIREVLAESTHRFATKAAAWGREGVEKFICASQTIDAFHLYFDRKKCCNRFYVACSDTRFIHPCQYDTAIRRDESLTQLYSAMKEFGKKNLPDLFFPHETNLVYDLEGEAIAVFMNMDAETSFSTYCCKLLELVSYIIEETGFEKNENGCFIKNEKQVIIAQSLNPETDLGEWKNKLLKLAYYFPIVKGKTGDNKTCFCIEIKLPCFNHPKNDLSNEESCGCHGPREKPCDNCYVAWKSSCCYETCQKAFEAYFWLLIILSDHKNYRPVYDCPCGKYGIELHSAEDMVAYNPQYYTTPDMNCQAVERAKSLINAEGLHVVEHILLRPRCEEDCRCAYYPQPCVNKTDCHFTWTVPGADDPCVKDQTICFEPGKDPYSFIATVALPAWPQRFRSKENRQLIEYMLQREAPAHVLLRVLWLAPHDLCCFERHFKQWLHWLAYQKNCCETYSPCQFLNFLFYTNFECLGEYDVCTPCQPVTVPVSCFTDPDDTLNQPTENTILNQINELYCWEPITCDKYEYVECTECDDCIGEPNKQE